MTTIPFHLSLCVYAQVPGAAFIAFTAALWRARTPVDGRAVVPYVIHTPTFLTFHMLGDAGCRGGGRSALPLSWNDGTLNGNNTHWLWRPSSYFSGRTLLPNHAYLSPASSGSLYTHFPTCLRPPFQAPLLSWYLMYSCEQAWAGNSADGMMLERTPRRISLPLLCNFFG